MRKPRVYLDHAASTPLAPAAREAMTGALEMIGSPSSPHAEGRVAKDRLEEARNQAAHALGCRPRELLFAPSGTVASQLGLRGVAERRTRAGSARRVVLSAVEHPAIGDAADALAGRGYEVIRVACDADGRINADGFLQTVGDDAAVAALMLANHETGTIQPVSEIADALRARGVPLVCDACLGPGRMPSRITDIRADVIALSAHKFGGPKGMGLLYARRGTGVDPLWTGGRQEERLLAGTENLASAAGMAAALEEALAATTERIEHYERLVQALVDGLTELEDWHALGPPTGRLPGVLTIELPGVEGEAAMINLDLEGVAVSTGSACALGATEPSAALRAMGLSRSRAASTLRVSVGECTEMHDVQHAARRLVDVARRLRRLARP